MSYDQRLATCFMVIRPTTRKAANVDRVTKTMPHSIPGNAIVIKVQLSIPDRAFRPPFFEAGVDVPEDYVGRIIVQAADPAPPAKPEDQA